MNEKCEKKVFCNICILNQSFREKFGIECCPDKKWGKVNSKNKKDYQLVNCVYRGELVEKGSCWCSDIWECELIGKQIGKVCGYGLCKKFSI